MSKEMLPLDIQFRCSNSEDLMLEKLTNLMLPMIAKSMMEISIPGHAIMVSFFSAEERKFLTIQATKCQQIKMMVG